VSVDDVIFNFVGSTCLPLLSFLGYDNCTNDVVPFVDLNDQRLNVAVMSIDKIGGIAGAVVRGGSRRIRKGSVSIDLIRILGTATRGISCNLFSRMLGDVFFISLKDILGTITRGVIFSLSSWRLGSSSGDGNDSGGSSGGISSLRFACLMTAATYRRRSTRCPHYDPISRVVRLLNDTDRNDMDVIFDKIEDLVFKKVGSVMCQCRCDHVTDIRHCAR